MLRFTGGSQATLDDQFDSSALLCTGFEDYKPGAAEEDDFLDPEELAVMDANYRRRRTGASDGRNMVTGY